MIFFMVAGVDTYTDGHIIDVIRRAVHIYLKACVSIQKYGIPSDVKNWHNQC